MESMDTAMQPQATEQKQERLFNQSELNEIVGRVRRETAERYTQQQASNMGHGMMLDPEQVKKLASEEIARQREEWIKQQEDAQMQSEVQRIVGNFQSKIADVRTKYEDFDRVAQDLDMSAYPSVVQMLAENVDNAADVLYELANNRSKLALLEQAYRLRPKDAIYDMNKLSRSIKDKQEAATVKQANAPLSQQKPSLGMSPTATDMRSLKNKYRV